MPDDERDLDATGGSELMEEIRQYKRSNPQRFGEARILFALLNRIEALETRLAAHEQPGPTSGEGDHPLR